MKTATELGASEKPRRQQFLEQCIDLTTRDRNKTYGGTYEQHKLFGELWSLVVPHLSKYSPSHNVAFLQVIAKISRIALGKFHLDNYLDGANYFVIAAECEETEQKNNSPVNECPPETLWDSTDPGQTLYEHWVAEMATRKEKVSPWESLTVNEHNAWRSLAIRWATPAPRVPR